MDLELSTLPVSDPQNNPQPDEARQSEAQLKIDESSVPGAKEVEKVASEGS